MSVPFEPRVFEDYEEPDPPRRNYLPAEMFCVSMSTRLPVGKPHHDRPGPEPKEERSR